MGSLILFSTGTALTDNQLPNSTLIEIRPNTTFLTHIDNYILLFITIFINEINPNKFGSVQFG
jgi:hypothetical protein